MAENLIRRACSKIDGQPCMATPNVTDSRLTAVKFIRRRDIYTRKHSNKARNAGYAM